jgi:RNA-binding protein 5/10
MPAQILEAFSKYAQVKDIRMIKDKNTGELRDFAFVEFFTLEDAGKVMQYSKKEDILINGCPIHLTYSKLKRGEVPVVVLNISI